MCLELWIKKYLQFYAEKFCLHKQGYNGIYHRSLQASNISTENLNLLVVK